MNDSEPDARRNPDAAGDARRSIAEARELLRRGNAPISQVDDLLEEAERSVPRTECRLDRPYAEIIQVGDRSGLHYECTHNPAHRFPG